MAIDKGKQRKDKMAKRRRKRRCARGVCNPERTQGLQAPAPKGDHELVNLKGRGVFLAAQVSKQGGDSGITFVDLEIDGRNVTNLSFAAAKNWGLTQQNPYGLVLLESSSIQNMTIGFPTPLRFRSSLTLKVNVDEDDVVQIVANVIHGQ
jgi:hypothetical protein